MPDFVGMYTNAFNFCFWQKYPATMQLNMIIVLMIEIKDLIIAFGHQIP